MLVVPTGGANTSVVSVMGYIPVHILIQIRVVVLRWVVADGC